MQKISRRIRVRSVGSPRLAKAGSLTSAAFPSPWRKAWLLLIPLAVMVFLIGAAAAGDREEPLANYALVGARSPSCVRIVVIRDQSGSMAGFASARELAMQQLVTWATLPDTLRSDDELAILDFAGDGQVALPTTVIPKIGAVIPPNAALDLEGSTIGEAVLAMKELPPTVCHTSLVVLSDGIVAALTAEQKQVLIDQGVTNVALVLPGDITVPEEWKSDFPYALTVESSADDANKTASAIGEAVAVSVAQRLEKRWVPET